MWLPQPHAVSYPSESLSFCWRGFARPRPCIDGGTIWVVGQTEKIEVWNNGTTLFLTVSFYIFGQRRELDRGRPGLEFFPFSIDIAPEPLNSAISSQNDDQKNLNARIVSTYLAIYAVSAGSDAVMIPRDSSTISNIATGITFPNDPLVRHTSFWK